MTNRTIYLSEQEKSDLRKYLITAQNVTNDNCLNKTIVGDCFDVLRKIQSESIDLAILDPPYNLNKKFDNYSFSKKSIAEYTEWLRELIKATQRLLRPTATIYMCGDWFTSQSISEVASQFFIVRNRITWEREKGRGAQRNWKNASEDIWFCTCSDNYTFNVNDVKLRRKVIAPYRLNDGTPKDWSELASERFRDTYPSNIWHDITVPFWSMPENTTHPTQKPEKLIAKLVLASSNPGDSVLDPMAGAGTTQVVAKKLGRNYIGIELQEDYALLAEKRLSASDTRIQGYRDGVFWERNSSFKLKQSPYPTLPLTEN